MKKNDYIRPIMIIAIGMVLGFNGGTIGEATSMDDQAKTMETATFAGGCFWCVESDFEKAPGVETVVSGYTGGAEKNPTYEAVSAGMTEHLEAVQVTYNPLKISYETVLDIFWRHIDPTDSGGQFVDRGPQYRSAVFYHSERQRQLAEKSKAEIEESGRFQKPIVTEIKPAAEFYPAEGYHQDYYKHNPMRYTFYRFNSGRDQFLEKVWAAETEKRPLSSASVGYSRPSAETIRQTLSPMQYEVTQQNGTEPPFDNEFWNDKREGIYVDIVSGEPLFSSTDKFDSGTGWPSFTRPIEPGNVLEKVDKSYFMARTEVRSQRGDSHLGHLFEDGPGEKGLRYCINSAALRFIPKAELEAKGYGTYLPLFKTD